MARPLVTAAGRAWLPQLTCVAAVSMFVAACDGGGADDGSLPSAGEGGAQAGGGASGGSSGASIGGAGGGGTSAGSGAGAGGPSGGAAGASVLGGAGGSGGGSLDDVDLTLGGLNQDLEAPSADCFAGEGAALSCMAVSGEYEGEAFDISCRNASLVHTWSSMQYTFGCRAEALGSEIEVELIVMRGFVEPAKAFEADVSTPSAFVRFWHVGADLESYIGRMFDLYGLDDTHDQTMAVAGASEVVDVTLQPGVSLGPMLRVDVAFALSLIPKSSCSPDAMGLGCDGVRLRGTLSAFPVQQ